MAKSLSAAKSAKNDEFYTQLSDIENELRHYKDQLKDKIIFCNCDDPFESNFFKYFAMNFKQIGLKKLIATCYDPSPVANTQLSLFDDDMSIKQKGMKKHVSRAYKIELDEISDMDGSGSIGMVDVEKMLAREKEILRNGGVSKILTYLDGDGDFRSDECIELLKQSDIVITNPPFSLFREYIAQLVEYDKKFIIIGNKNAVTYKEVFKLIQDNKLWLGYRNINSDMWLILPDKSENYEKIVDGKKLKHIMACWYTNLFVDRSEDPIVPYIKYEDGVKRGLYPKYDNYDAIEVSKVAEIPVDYYGAMGVPITFLGKWVPPVLTERERERGVHHRRTGQVCQGQSDTEQTNAYQQQGSLCKNHHQACMNMKSLDVATPMANQSAITTTDGVIMSASTAKKSINDYLLDKFEIIWTTDRGGDGMLDHIKKPHTRYDAPVVNGKGLYKRIIIKRRGNNKQ